MFLNDGARLRFQLAATSAKLHSLLSLHVGVLIARRSALMRGVHTRRAPQFRPPQPPFPVIAYAFYVAKIFGISYYQYWR